MIKPGQRPADRQLAMFVFDDVVEFLGPQSLPFFQYFFPYALQYVNDPEHAVRQAAVYGMGLCAQFGGEHIRPAIPDMVARLTQAINSPDARSPNWINPTENAIGAVAKILKFQSAAIDQNALLQQFLQWLPVTEDTVESKPTYGILCDLIEQNSSFVLGQQLQNAPKIVSVFADALQTDLVNEELSVRMVTILKQIGTLLGSRENLGRIWVTLNQSQQQKLGGIFS